MIIQKEDEEYLWAICLNPNHKDKNASLCINKTDSGKYERGYGYCYSCGFTIKFSEEAIKKMSNKKSIARKKVPVNWVQLNKKFMSGGVADYNSIKLAHGWNCSLATLRLYGIGWDGEAHTFPMRNEDLSVCGIMRRFPDGSKLCVHGSNLALFFPLNGPLNLFSDLVICEGLSDAVIATEIGFKGIGKPSSGFGEQIIRKLLENEGYKGKIIIVADNDAAGKRSSIKLQDALKGWDTRTVTPDLDLRQYYLDNGANTTRKLLGM